MKCDYCEAAATKVAYYGDEDTVIGGGMGAVYTCQDHTSPCNLPSDPHTSCVREESIGGAAGMLIYPEFCCPACGGKYWGTRALDAGTVDCHARGCGWTGHRSQCGLA